MDEGFAETNPVYPFGFFATRPGFAPPFDSAADSSGQWLTRI
jgi:hypothetical protein